MSKKLPMGKAEAHDPALHMEMETLRAEREARLSAEEMQVERERKVAKYHQLIGRIQGAKMVADFGNVATFVWLSEVHREKLYLDMPGIETWIKFCDSTGISRRKIEEGIKDLEAFGEEFLATVATFRISQRDLRKLRQLTHDGSVVIEGECLTIPGDDPIPIDQDHADDLQAAIERIVTASEETKKRVEKLEKNMKAAVDEETKGFKSEKKALLERIQSLEQFEPKEADREWSVKQMANITKAANSLQLAISGFIVDPRLKDDRHLQALVNQHLQEAEMALHDVRRRLDDVIDMFND